MNPSKGGNYGPMPAPVQQPMPESRPRYDDVGGPALPSPAELSNLRPAVQPPMSPSKGGTQQQKGGYNFAGQYDPNMPSGYGTDYQTFGGPRPEPVQQPMPAPMPMVQPIPQAQPMPAMMPSKGGIPAAQFNPQPVPLNQSPNITPARQNSSPFGPRNMRYGR